MIAIKIKICICLLIVSVSEVLACESPSFGSKVIPNLIEIEANEKDHPKFFHISIPYEVKGLVLNTASLEYGCIDEESKFSFIPLALRRDGEFMKTEVFMNFKESRDWKVHATYLTERREQDPIVLDGPAIESWEVLKPYKIKNVKASKAGPDAPSTRPF